jgi:hypothetical protein
MKPKLLFSIVFQVPFEPDPDLYDTNDPKVMATAVEKEANETPLAAFLSMAHHSGGKYKVRVSPILSTEDQTGLVIKGRDCTRV